MKKLFSLLIVLCLAIGISVPVLAADSGEIDFGQLSRFQLGDVNTDTTVDSGDLIALRKILLSESALKNKQTTDINYDDDVNIIDLVRLKKKLAGITTSLFTAQAETLKSKIMNAKEGIPVEGKHILYVAATGTCTSYSASGAENPLSFVEFIKRNPINGTLGWLENNGIDTVLFKRGEVYRSIFIPVSGVAYGAYGEGDKPAFYGSAQNYADAEWQQDGTFYSISLSPSYDAGNIIFNDGEKVGYKRSSLEDVTKEFDFYHDLSSGILYVYLTKAPSDYDSIEIAVDKKIVNIQEGAQNITIDNLAFKYTGAHGVYAENGSQNITIKNCEFAYLGGSYIMDHEPLTRYGNAIEFWQGCDEILVEVIANG